MMNRVTKTAREIGKLTNRTAQNINKRLLANGLMYASADGYHLTEAGEPYGIEKVKNGATYDSILAVLTNPNCKVDDNTKISSYEPNLTVKLTLTTKLISKLKEWFPESVLVGFKLLENVSREHIIEVAQKLCIKNKMDSFANHVR